MKKSTLPQFICIGSARCGSTWLYKNLKKHPQIYVTPHKELNYFNKYAIKFNVLNMLRSPRKNNKLIRIGKRLWRNKGKDIQWYLRYLFLPRTDKWYASLFQPTQGQLIGEVSPHYYLVEEKMVKHIHSLMPNIKIIFLIRNPINKIWSQAAMKFGKKRVFNIDDVSMPTLKKYLLSKMNLDRVQYTDAIKKWEKFYPKEQIFIGYFDQLEQNPKQFFQEILQFLEIGAPSFVLEKKNIKEKYNIRSKPSIPTHLSELLANKYYKNIEVMHNELNNEYTANWLAYTKQLLNTNKET